MNPSILDHSDAFDLRDRTYLNGAAHGPMPRRALEAARRALDGKRDPTTIDDRDYFDLPDRIRVAAAKLLGSAPEDVALATGASHGISLVACGLDWEPGDHVVVPRGEFPSNNVPWLVLRARGVEVEFVDPDHLTAAIRDDTRVVSVGHVNFATGRRVDLEPIGEACERVGALFMVDAAQSLGALPFDVEACRASVVAVAGYKWLMCPYGTGLTYVAPRCVERLRLPAINWATIEGADDFNKLTDLEPRQRPGAIRFDVPETAAFIHGAAMAESLEMIVEIGVQAIQAHTVALIDRIVEGLPTGFRSGSSMQPEHRSSILRIEGDSSSTTRRAYESLRQAGIAVSLRESGLRVGPGLWNNVADVDRLVEHLERVPQS